MSFDDPVPAGTMSNEDSKHTDIMSYDIPVPKVQALSHDTDELNFTDDYADIKGSTIWRDTLATSGLGFTAEEIRSLELSDEELLTLGLTDEELLALRLQNEVYSMKNTSDGKASDDTDGDDIPSARASVIITMDDEQEGRTESALVTRYTYDSFNRLLRYSDHTGSTCYSYNADGYRTAKYDYSDSSDVTRYLTIGGRNLFETSCAGSFTALNTYGTTLTSRASLAGGYEYRSIVYLYSAYGDVVLVADAQTGDSLATYAYDPFGNVILAGTTNMSEDASGETDGTGELTEAGIQTELSEVSSIDNPYGYRGYVKDDESGLYYLNARYYDSTSGRFLTADTFRGSKDDPLSLNRYVYCQSNPVRYTDPSGHSVKEFFVNVGTKIENGVTSIVVEVKEGFDDVKHFVKEKKENIITTGVGTWHVGAGAAALTIGVGAVVTVCTAGAATPVWMLISAGVLGGGAAVCGASEVYEGTQTIVYAWDSTAAAPVNPVRDYVFDDLLHDRDDYYLFMAMSTMGAGYLTQQIDLTYGVETSTIGQNKTDSVKSQKSNMPNKANNKDAGKAINDFETSYGKSSGKLDWDTVVSKKQEKQELNM